MEEAIIKVSIEGEDGRKTAKQLREELVQAKDAAAKVGENLSKGAAEAESKTVSLKAQLKAMKAELATLPEDSKRFREVAKAAGELEDKIGDINQKVTALSSDTKKLDALVGAGNAIAGGFQAAQGAIALFGSDSKVVEESIKNIIAVQGIMNGVQQVGQFITAKGIIQDTIRLGLTSALTAAQWLLNAAMTANPIGLIIVGVAALTAGIVLLIQHFETVANFMLSLIGLGDSFDTQQEAAHKAQMQREKENSDALKKRLKELDELRKAEAEAHQQRQTAYDLEIARAEAEGKSSRELKLAKIQDIVDETKAVLEHNSLKIQAYVDYYKQQAVLRGQSEADFIASMKAIGVDLVELQKKADLALQTNRDAVFQAETDLLALKRDFREEDQKEAQKAADEKKKLADQELEEKLKFEKFLFDLETNRRAADVLFQEQLQAEKDAQFEAETIRMEQEIDREREQKERQLEITKELAAERDALNQKNLDTATTLLKIAEDAAVVFQGKEFARIKAKQEAGEKLTTSEIARLKRAEKVQKAFAIAQVAIDTARGISAAVAAGAGLVFPANIPAILSGVAAVLAGVKQAKAILGDSSSAGEADSGGAAASSNTVNQQVETTGSQEANVIQSGSTLLNQEPQKVYVVESDITKKQTKVKVIEAAATFGG